MAKPDIQAHVTAYSDGSFGWKIFERFDEKQPWNATLMGTSNTLTKAFIDAQGAFEKRQARHTADG